MRNFLLPGLVALLCSGAMARADLSFSSSLVGSDNVANPSDATSKIFIKDGTTRTEVKLLGSPMVILTWSNGDSAQIDPTAKIYTVRTAAKIAADPTDFTGGPMHTVVNVLNLGDQTLKGAKRAHWRLDFDAPTGGPQNKVSVEMWSSDTAFPAPAKEKNTGGEAAPVGFRALIAGNAKVKANLKGLGPAFAMVPLRTRTLVDGEPRTTFEVGDISTADLDPALFRMPTDFRMVSRDEWNKLQREVVEKKMRELTGKTN